MNDTAHCWPIRVYWEDTDGSGVVYHANYLRWFERGRTEWLRARGYDQQRLLAETGIAFTVAALDIVYRKPARLDDELEVVTELAERRNASLSFRQQLRHAAAPQQLLAEGQVRVACVDATTFALRRIPPLGL